MNELFWIGIQGGMVGFIIFSAAALIYILRKS